MIKVQHIRKEYLKGKRVSKEVRFLEIESVQELNRIVRHLASTSTMYTTIGTKGQDIAYTSLIASKPKESRIDIYKIVKE